MTCTYIQIIADMQKTRALATVVENNLYYQTQACSDPLSQLSRHCRTTVTLFLHYTLLSTLMRRPSHECEAQYLLSTTNNNIFM